MSSGIRLATPEDARSIARVHVAGWRHAYRGILPDDLLDGLSVDERAVQRKAWLENPRDPAMRCWVLEEPTQISGFAMTGPVRDDDLGPTAHELYAVYVDPAVIGTGRGRRLMDHVIADLRRRDYRELVLWMLTDNRPTRAFYKAAGFVEDRRTPEVEHTAGRMKLRLVRPL